MKELAVYVANKEAGKKEVAIGQIREILAILSDLTYETQGEVGDVLWFNGQRRKRRKK